ncbi:hypothetical protein GCM10009611_00920 [Arthrobacter roseus]
MSATNVVKESTDSALLLVSLGVVAARAFSAGAAALLLEYSEVCEASVSFNVPGLLQKFSCRYEFVSAEHCLR